MKTTKPLALAAITLATVVSTVEAENQGPYYLWKPTPKSELRPIESDIMRVVVSPLTLDAGHIQLEVNPVRYYQDDPVTYRSFTYGSTYGIETANFNGWEFGQVALKVGVFEKMDVQIGLRPYQQITSDYDETVYSPGSGTINQNYRGTSEYELNQIYVASKINLWGNDGGTTALSFMPFFNVPTVEPRSYLGYPYDPGYLTGGFLVPLRINLPGKFQLGVQAGAHFFEYYDYWNGEFDIEAEILTGITLQRHLFAGLAAFAEFSTTWAYDYDYWNGKINGGFTYTLNRHLQLHIGSDFGVEHSWDYSPYFGCTFRY